MAHTPTHIVTSPARVHFWWGVASVVGLLAGVGHLYSSNFEDFNTEMGYIFITILAALYFFYRAAKPTVRVRVSSDGLWTKPTGLQPWKMVKSVEEETRRGYKGIKETHLIIEFHPIKDVSEMDHKIDYDFSDLNTTPEKLLPDVWDFMENAD